jgi:prepilin-type processing-associated H-X9-DG protein
MKRTNRSSNLRKTRLQPAFTVLELLIVMACLLIVAALVFPNLSPPYHRAKRINCTNNLKQVGLAFRTWALDHNDHYPGQVAITNGGTMELVQNGSAFIHFEVMSNELSTPKVLICPADSNRTSAGSFLSLRNTNLSFFYCPDADANSPDGFLSGDDNLTLNGTALQHGLRTISTNDVIAWTEARHSVQGNVGLADGSVQQFSPTRLAEAFAKSGFATNRLLMP